MVTSYRTDSAAAAHVDGALRAQVRGGRLVLDEPTDLPEGAVVNLVAIDGYDDLDDAERAELHAAIDAAFAEPEEQGITPEALFARLRPVR